MQAPAKELRIRNGADLFEALRSPLLGTRVSVLGAIATYPQRALEYSREFEPDLVTWLLSDAAELPHSVLRNAVLKALFAFDDARVGTFILGEFKTSESAEYLLSLLERLRREPPQNFYPYFAPYLFRDDAPAHTRAAATLLANCPTLTLEERIRVAVLVRTEWPAPPLDDASETPWLAELHGAERGTARRLLRAHGRPALERLCARWDVVPRDSRQWLLEWGFQEHADVAVEPLRHALQEDDVDLMREALRMVPRNPLFAPLLQGLQAHADPVIRAGAVAAGAGNADECRARLLESGLDRGMRLACLQRLGAEPSPANGDVLVAALQDAHWQIRAAAVNALATQGESVCARVEPLVTSDNVAVKAAAIQVLLSYGREAWLEEKLLI